jgi:pilus assembly protein CpaE
MPDGLPGGRPAVEDAGSRTDRAPLLCFTTDAATEAALREGLADMLPVAPDIRRADIRGAITALQREATPSTLVVDVSGDAQPLAALEDLAQVVEPDVTVLVIGDRQDMDFYRRITRGLGVREYLFKPLTAEFVARHFGPAVGGRVDTGSVVRGGRVLTVMGARPGVGASTIVTNLAWYLGALANRHTLLLDADLRTGTAAMMLGVPPTTALLDGLRNPLRMDDVYISRAVQAVGPRLDVLASESGIAESVNYTADAMGPLLDLLQRRYNFIVIDLIGRGPLLRQIGDYAHQGIVVLDPSLPAIRDTLRLLALATGPRQVRRPLLVLNRAGAPGGLTTAEVTDALQCKPEIVIPDIGRRAREAELAGKPIVSSRGPMYNAVAEIASRAAGVRPPASGWRFPLRVF